MRVETVKIKHGESYAVINASDFKPSEHELFEEAAIQIGEQFGEQSTSQQSESPATQVTESPAIDSPPEPTPAPRAKRLVKRKLVK